MNGRSILDADMKTIAGWAVSGWHWWLSELTAMIPPRWREGGVGRQRLAAWQPDSASLVAADDGPLRVDGAVAVVLPSALTLVRQLEYPAVGARDLAGLVALDAERILPLPREEVLIGTRQLGSDPARGRMTVEVAGLPLADAAQLAEALSRSGLRPLRVLVGPPERGAPAPIDLLPAIRAAGLAGGGGRAATPLWLMVAALFALNLGLLVWRDAAAVDSLAEIVAQQQPAQMVVRRITARMHRADALAAAALAARSTSEPLALLARLGSALPPGTWIQRLSWQGTALQVAGYRPPKTDVPGAMRRAGFAVTRYGETSNAAPTPAGEPFEITLRMGGH